MVNTESTFATKGELMKLSISLVRDAVQSRQYKKAQNLALAQLEKYPRNGDLYFYLFLSENEKSSISEIAPTDIEIRRKVIKNSRLMNALQWSCSFHREIVACLKQLYTAELKENLNELRGDHEAEAQKSLEEMLLGIKQAAGAYWSEGSVQDIIRDVQKDALFEATEAKNEKKITLAIEILKNYVPDNDVYRAVYDKLGSIMLEDHGYDIKSVESTWRQAASYMDESSAASYIEEKMKLLGDRKFIDEYGSGKNCFTYFFIKRYREKYEKYASLLERKKEVEEVSPYGWLTIPFSMLMIACSVYLVFSDNSMMRIIAQIGWIVSSAGALYFWDKMNGIYLTILEVILYFGLQLLNKWIGDWWLIGGLIRLVANWMVPLFGLFCCWTCFGNMADRNRIETLNKQIDDMYYTEIQPLEQSLYEEVKDVLPGKYGVTPRITPIILENYHSLLDDVRRADKRKMTVAQYLAEKEASGN